MGTGIGGPGHRWVARPGLTLGCGCVLGPAGLGSGGPARCSMLAASTGVWSVPVQHTQGGHPQLVLTTPVPAHPDTSGKRERPSNWLGAGTPLPCQTCCPHPQHPTMPPIPSPHSQAPTPPTSPSPEMLAEGTLPSTSPRGDAAASSRERHGMPGCAVRQLLGLGAPRGGPFPMALPWECFSCSRWEPDLGNSKSISAGSPGAATPRPHAGSPARCLCSAGSWGVRPLGSPWTGKWGHEGWDRQVPWGHSSTPRWALQSHSPQGHRSVLNVPAAQGNSCCGPLGGAGTAPVCTHTCVGCGEAPAPQCPKHGVGKPGFPRGGSQLLACCCIPIAQDVPELSGIPQQQGSPCPLHGFTPANPRCSCHGAKLGYAEESSAGQKERGSSGALLAWGAKTSPHRPPAASQGMLARPQAPLAASTSTLRGWHPAVPRQGAVTGTTRRMNPPSARRQDASPRQAGLAPGPPAPPAAAAWPSTAHAAHRSRGGPWPRASRCRQVTVFPGRHPRRGPARVPWPPPAGAGPPGPAPTAPPRPPGPSSTAGRDGGPRRLRASGQAVTQRLGAHAAGLPLLRPRPGGGTVRRGRPARPVGRRRGTGRCGPGPSGAQLPREPVNGRRGRAALRAAPSRRQHGPGIRREKREGEGSLPPAARPRAGRAPPWAGGTGNSRARARAPRGDARAAAPAPGGGPGGICSCPGWESPGRPLSGSGALPRSGSGRSTRGAALARVSPPTTHASPPGAEQRRAPGARPGHGGTVRGRPRCAAHRYCAAAAGEPQPQDEGPSNPGGPLWGRG